MGKLSPRYATERLPAVAPVRGTWLRRRKAPNRTVGIADVEYVPVGRIGITSTRRSSWPGGFIGGGVKGDLFKYCVLESGCAVFESGG